MEERLGEEIGSELSNGMSREGCRRREQKAMRREWESSAEESDQSQNWSMEEKIRRLTVRIEGLERRKRLERRKTREEEKTSRGSSSEFEEGNGRWKWENSGWWCRVDNRGTTNSRLKRRISRAVKQTLE